MALEASALPADRCPEWTNGNKSGQRKVVWGTEFCLTKGPGFTWMLGILNSSPHACTLEFDFQFEFVTSQAHFGVCVLLAFLGS